LANEKTTDNNFIIPLFAFGQCPRLLPDLPRFEMLYPCTISALLLFNGLVWYRFNTNEFAATRVLATMGEA
jgi:hypothetical protein